MSETSIIGISNDWLRKNKILVSVCSEKEKEFLLSIYNCYRDKEDRSIKQKKWFRSIQYRCRLNKIPDKLPKEKPKINLNKEFTHEESLKIVKDLIENYVGRGWDSYTKWQQEFLKKIAPQIKKPEAKLNGKQYKTICDIIHTTKKRIYNYDKFVGCILSRQKTKELTGSHTNTVKIIAINRTLHSAILCNLITNKKIVLKDEWIQLKCVYSPKRTKKYELRKGGN